MLKWVQSGLSAVAGTAEPEYGREAIQTVVDSIGESDQVYRETTIEDFAWKSPAYTNVETQTFYFTCLKTGIVGFAQVIHLNILGVHTTAQFTFKLIELVDGKLLDKQIWTSTKLEEFRTDGSNFYATNLSIELSEDNTTYVLKSSVTPESVVDITVTKVVPGVIFGKDGVTNYGDDPANPWGSMRHVFWPRCDVKGTVKHGEEIIEIEGLTMFVMALQGMKPHHAAKAWNFLNFQSEKYSAVQMEFTTPPSYGNTTVNVGVLTSKDKILKCLVGNKVLHYEGTADEVGWPVPKSIEYKFDGKSQEKDVDADIKGDLTNLAERVDVMAEIPQFVKNIVSGVAGTKPYIYQFCNNFTAQVGDDKENGIAFCEVTFISE